MSGSVRTTAGSLQRNCARDRRRAVRWPPHDARLVTGEHRMLRPELRPQRGERSVPAPRPRLERPHAHLRHRVAVRARRRTGSRRYAVEELPPRELAALAVVEGQVALGWIAATWRGLLPEFERVLGGTSTSLDPDLDDSAHPRRRHRAGPVTAAARGPPAVRSAATATLAAAGARRARCAGATAGCPGARRSAPGGASTRSPSVATAACATPTCRRRAGPRTRTSTSGPTSGSASRTRSGTCGRKRFLPDHVAVLERPLDADDVAARRRSRRRCAAGSRSTPTGSMRNGLEDGSRPRHRPLRRPLRRHGRRARPREPRVFRDLVPGVRDVTTALLLDGSSSLGAHGGKVFELELACADSLSQAMTLAAGAARHLRRSPATPGTGSTSGA